MDYLHYEINELGAEKFILAQRDGYEVYVDEELHLTARDPETGDRKKIVTCDPSKLTSPMFRAISGHLIENAEEIVLDNRADEA